MRVQQLIEALQELPPNYVVQVSLRVVSEHNDVYFSEVTGAHVYMGRVEITGDNAEYDPARSE